MNHSFGEIIISAFCNLLGEQLWTFAALAGVLCDGIVVDELPTSLISKVTWEEIHFPGTGIDNEEKRYLVKWGNKTGVIVEGCEDQSIVLSVHLTKHKHNTCDFYNSSKLMWP